MLALTALLALQALEPVARGPAFVARAPGFPDGARLRLELQRRRERFDWATGRLVERFEPAGAPPAATVSGGRLEVGLSMPGAGRYRLEALFLPCLQTDAGLRSRMKEAWREHRFAVPIDVRWSEGLAARVGRARALLERHQAAFREGRPPGSLEELRREAADGALPAASGTLLALLVEFEASRRLRAAPPPDGEAAPVAVSSVTGERITPEAMLGWVERTSEIAGRETGLWAVALLREPTEARLRMVSELGEPAAGHAAAVLQIDDAAERGRRLDALEAALRRPPTDAPEIPCPRP